GHNLYCVIFFFFQAEDGIRDATVTGVQTCALPISRLQAPLILIHGAYDPCIPAQQSIELAEAARANGIEHTLMLLQMYGHTNPRSEERRVGKECESGWWREQEYEKRRKKRYRRVAT